jgi:hypothetical protein
VKIASKIALVPYRKIIADLLEKQRQLEAQPRELETQIEEMRQLQAQTGVKDDTKIISGMDVVTCARQEINSC